MTEKLKQLLAQPLPGKEAQYRMAPAYRPDMNKEEIQQQNPRLGAVLLLLYLKDAEWYTVFTQRWEYKGVHSGQMSFPGGKMEPTDADLIATALREAQEEVGVEPTKLTVLGQLSELYIPPSNYLVQPVVAFSPTLPVFTAQPSEVKEIVEIPVNFFLDENNKRTTEIKLPQGNTFTVPAYIYKEYVIWGATAIILSEFSAVWKGLES